MQILVIAGYKFITLDQLETLREGFLKITLSLALKGTILLSHEGININLAGQPTAIDTFIASLQSDNRFADICFHQTKADSLPFQKLKIKLKKEIISMRQPSVNAVSTRAPTISAEMLKKWLDTHREMTLLDTRNDYEVSTGTFVGATQLHIDDFSAFPSAITTIEKDKPIVMFCTGGIRCEKAALYMLDQGFSTVYQLDGGILGYFAKVGKAHFQGKCFIFDERLTVDVNQL